MLAQHDNLGDLLSHHRELASMFSMEIPRRDNGLTSPHDTGGGNRSDLSDFNGKRDIPDLCAGGQIQCS